MAGGAEGERGTASFVAAGPAPSRVFRFWTLCLLALLLAVPPGAGQAVQSCGEGLELFIRNPDITADNHGVFHVSGRLLVQFQVIGERADEIEAFGLSFGVGTPVGEEICALPPAAWATGVYAEGYALDQDKSDGFFIAINSNGQTSPQADLGVAVHGYDASGAEVARFWGIVRLDNCGNPPEGGCPDDPSAVERDFTMPWPIILPGDGAARPIEGFAVEFNEPLTNFTIELNGEDVTGEMEEWAERPQWDQDNIPDAGPQGLFAQVAAPCSLPSPVHTCGPLYGPGLVWTKRAMTDADIIRVIGTDINGNVAVKEIHIGSSVAGGTISDGLPILQMTFEESSAMAAPGETAVFRMRMENTGGGEGHPFATAEVPEGWNYTWVPGHQPVPAGGRSEQELHVVVGPDAEPGRVPIRALIEYRQGSQDKSLESQLFVHVTRPVEAAPTDAAEADGEEQESPGAGAGAGAVVIALVAVAMARARRP